MRLIQMILTNKAYKVLATALTLLLPSLVLAQESFIQNEAQTTFYSTAGTAAKAAVDKKGNIYVIPVSTSGLTESVIPISNNTSLNGIGTGTVGWTTVSSPTVTTGSTTTVIQITGISSTARVGDAFQAATGTAANIGSWSPIIAVATNAITVSNAFPTAPVNTDTGRLLRPTPIGSSAQSTAGSSINVNLSSNTNIDTSSPVRAEDVAFANAEGVMMAGGVNNSAGNSFNATAGDVTPFAVSGLGAILPDLNPVLQSSNSPIKNEDAAFSDGQGVIMAGYQAVSAIVQSVSTTGDAAPPSMDLGNRLVITNAPAGETFQSCGTATAVTSDVAIKTSVASNRMYVTSFTCKNTSIVASSTLDFKDGSTVIAVGGIGALVAASGTSGSFNVTFPVPLRGTSATALNFATNTAVTSVTCCASGYISTI